ncbi:MAG: HNH endonuclease [Gracilimonas sp.]
MKNKWNETDLRLIIEQSTNKSQVLRKIGLKSFTGNYDTLNKYIFLYNIDVSHFRRPINYSNLNKKKIPISEILVSGSSYSRTSLKKRLFNGGLKERRCEKCGNDEWWNGEKMSLILDHINGIHNDNRIENLRILCPNCNSTLPTHCGRNTKDRKIKSGRKPAQKHFCDCGKEIRRGSTQCHKCHSVQQRKVKRPSREQLLFDIHELGYSGTGRRYGVSDNAVRKWLKKSGENL